MQSLLQFLIRHNFAFLFLLLQGLSIAFYIQSHYFQRAQFINSANALTGNVYESVSDVESYFSLKTENENLTKENEVLHSLMPYSNHKLIDNHILVDDTLYEQQYYYFPAKVINSSTQRKNNFMTINRGTLNGVTEDMAVIGPLGVVGSIKDVSEHFATVVPIIHSTYRLDVRVKRNNQLGTISWRNDLGLTHRKAHIQDIPITSNVVVGDTIVTSGYSKIYPSSIGVGIVSDVQEVPEESRLNIIVDLFTDYGKISNVHVVENLFRDEWKKLEEELENQAN